MAHTVYDELVLDFASSMIGKHIDSDVINHALQELCVCGEFDAGAVYEIDQNDDFRLKEHHARPGIVVPDCFASTELDPDYRKQLSESIITAINVRDDASENDTLLLHIFAAASLVCVTTVNQNMRINGLIVFFARKGVRPADKALLKPLNVLLHMLKGYVAVRIYQNKLQFAQTTLESILDNTGIDIYAVDYNSYDILYANKSMAEPYGGIEAFTGKKCWKVLFPGQTGPCEFCPQSKLIDEHGKPTRTYSWDYQRGLDGSWFRVFSSAFRWIDGRLAHVVSSANITDNKRNEELVNFLANFDSLTGLPNRRSLVAECERRINNASPDETGFLLFFDIDGFKAVNDNFGHDAGDEFLVQLGAFFSAIPMLKNNIFRNGGDEFVALIDRGYSENDVRQMVACIHERFQQPWNLKNGSVFCNTSVGVACYPEDGTTAEALLHMADQAMYQIKKKRGGSLCFARDVRKVL